MDAGSSTAESLSHSPFLTALIFVTAGVYMAIGPLRPPALRRRDQNGRQTPVVPHYEDNGEPAVTLRPFGVIE